MLKLSYYPGVFGGNIAIDHLKKNAPVTLFIIAVNLIIFILAFILGGQQQLILRGGMPPIEYVILTGEYWRLLSSMFIHSGIMHVAFNMIILLHAGGYLEQYIGSRIFAFFYFFSGLLVSFFSGLFTNALSVGASGAVFAVLGFLTYFELKARKLGYRSNSMLLPLVGINIVITLLIPRISSVAHFSGLIIGYLFALYKDRNAVKS